MISESRPGSLQRASAYGSGTCWQAQRMKFKASPSLEIHPQCPCGTRPYLSLFFRAVVDAGIGAIIKDLMASLTDAWLASDEALSFLDYQVLLLSLSLLLSSSSSISLFLYLPPALFVCPQLYYSSTNPSVCTTTRQSSSTFS